ncbi:MAG: hypothetical protein LBP35_06440 [Candidatus Ancillula trichonymphae]|nr:hypothetical protein [Candidatus Ancillula trichonymphae]
MGTIGLAVVENAAKLTLVEVDKQNTKYAMQNAKTRNMHGARIITQNAFQVLKYIPGSGTLCVGPTPRAGGATWCGRTGSSRRNQERIIYLSCTPST